jgi:hypothetical protein
MPKAAATGKRDRGPREIELKLAVCARDLPALRPRGP